jgi:protein TonB
MVRTSGEQDRSRVKSAFGVALVHALVGSALIFGVGVETQSTRQDPLKLIQLSPEMPPPPVEPKPPAEARKDAAAPSPPSRSADPSPIVVPPAEVKLEVPPLLAAAPVAGLGSGTAIGFGKSEGLGTGSGGEGTGAGTGTGGDGRGEAHEPPTRTRRIEGHFTNRDYPKAAERAGIEGTVAARLAIDANGRVSQCTIRVSSGNEALDGTTCAIILDRFRFTPARNGKGEAVADIVEWEQNWSLRREGGPEVADAQCRVRADKIAERRAARTEYFSCMAALGWRRR